VDTLKPEIIKTIKKFIGFVRKDGVKIEKVFLFGSYAKGKAGKWSDIDLAVISKDFSGVSFYDRQKVNPFIIKTDARIEVHPFRPEDFSQDNPFVSKIITEGVEISSPEV